MAQEHLRFGTYTAPDVDEDGYTVQLATTSTAKSGRTPKGKMKNKVMFTVESYNVKWTDISAKKASSILAQIVNKDEFDFFHFNAYKAKWEIGKFYVSNFNLPVIRLNEGEERYNELSFQVTCINPLVI